MKKIPPKESKRIDLLFITFIVVVCLFFISLAFQDKPDQRYVLLSFDVETVDGKQDVMEVLDVVYRHNISATFFITGEYAAQNPEMVKLMTGREVGCHGYSHQSFKKMSLPERKEEVVGCKKVLESLTGNEVIGFRAPYNKIDKETLGVLENEGFVYDASMIKGLGFIYPSVLGFSLGEIPVSSVLGIPLEDVVWLHYLRLQGTYFYILKHKESRLESYLFHPHHIAPYKKELEELINYLKEENVIFISHAELIEMEDAGV
jgi:peptidoglycan/xylan/chitin deacetylase (PgdA/CDA1 family)